MTIQSPSCPTQSRVFSHKRRRSATFAKQQDQDPITSATDSYGMTSDESSGDDSDDNSIENIEEETLVAVKRRRRADLDGLKKSVRLMEAQVVDASAQLRDLAAVVAQVVVRRQLHQIQGPGHQNQHTHHIHVATGFRALP